jgi:CheY-like chemotaxis protein
MTGVDALAELTRAVYDLMILDLVMPQKGGIETIMDIRGVTPGLPIIVVSGKITPGDASTTRLLQQYGAIAVLGKPFSADELREAVSASLSA